MGKIYYMGKYIIILYWPICSGKSVLTNLLLQKAEGVFLISPDKVKRFISKYDPNKYLWIPSRLIFDLAKSAIQEGFSLIVEGNTKIQKDMRKDYKIIGEEHNYNFFEFNIEAPVEILIERFLKRVADAKEKWNNITLTEVDQMMIRYNHYRENKKNTIPTIDSSLHTTEEIYNIIYEIINQTEK